MPKQPIHTSRAPRAVGPYSQAVATGNVVYCSGQIALDPATNELNTGSFEQQVRQIFANLGAVAKAAGGSLDDAVKITAFLTDLSCFAEFNELMEEFFSPPFPARAAVGVTALPLGVDVEVDAILALDP
ncbi:MAG: RidA family protein [Pseudomonadales bacterium]|nr:RidA family protein [Pseudomonadales bacterium]